MTIDQLCDTFYISREQKRLMERTKTSKDALQGYIERGCFKCDGKDKSCEIYSTYLSHIDRFQNDEYYKK